jgi:transposase
LRLPIHAQREVARLHFYDPNQSSRAIGRIAGVSTNSVIALRSLLATRDIPQNLFDLDDDAWTAALGNEDKGVAQRKEAPDWNWVYEQMQRPDATLEALWREWREVCPDGIGYSQFTDGFRRWTKQQHIVFRRVHIPGEKLFVDFAGTTVTVRSPEGGPSVEAQIFVAALGFSNYTFVYAVPAQTVPYWLECHEECFAYLGGVPKWVVPDNLKAAVIRRGPSEVVLNQAYRELLTHYGTAALPTGSRKPKEKSKVEVSVQIVQRLVLFGIRDMDFFSMAELQAELRRRTALVNARLFKKMSGSRLQRFEETEHAALQPLPQTPYERCVWRHGVRVGDDYHVEHERSFYSTPSALRGEKVDLRITGATIEIMCRSRRVALHALATVEGSVVTTPEHRPVAHTRVLEGEPKALIAWAESVGPNTMKMIRHHLQDRADLTNGLKAAKRMREMARIHGGDRFEEVCAYALPLNITALRSIESIVKKSPDKAAPAVSSAARPTHVNVRGARYFGEAA